MFILSETFTSVGIEKGGRHSPSCERHHQLLDQPVLPHRGHILGKHSGSHHHPRAFQEIEGVVGLLPLPRDVEDDPPKPAALPDRQEIAPDVEGHLHVRHLCVLRFHGIRLLLLHIKPGSLVDQHR